MSKAVHQKSGLIFRRTFDAGKEILPRHIPNSQFALPDLILK